MSRMPRVLIVGRDKGTRSVSKTRSMRVRAAFPNVWIDLTGPPSFLSPVGSGHRRLDQPTNHVPGAADDGTSTARTRSGRSCSRNRRRGKGFGRPAQCKCR